MQCYDSSSFIFSFIKVLRIINNALMYSKKEILITSNAFIFFNYEIESMQIANWYFQIDKS